MPPRRNIDPAILKKAFGATVAARRKAAGMCVSAFARTVPLCRKHMADIESGRAAPNLLTMANLATALDTTLEDLMAETQHRALTYRSIFGDIRQR